MADRDREQLQRWLRETEDDSESVLGVQDPDESEEDDVEYFDENTSDEIDEEGNPPDTSPAGGVEVPDVGMEEEPDIPGIALVAGLQGPFVNPEFYLGNDRETKCYLDPQVSRTRSRTPRHNIIPTFHRPGPQGNAKNAQTPVMALQCMITDEMITKIVD
ncbi:hypothetical protein J6590_072121 [Homalodisca vitripennis]|nr:hypothetical protein J6590_072121 [Homalodisca vitripennis]